jgi:Domain of unknown function (DUF4304)
MRTCPVAPGLRAIGFKGSGQNYRLPSDDHWAMLGFQKSTSSDPTHVRFTANVVVVSRSSWDAVRAESPHLPERPTATTYWGTYVWQKRIGELLPDGEDMWWDVEAGADEAELADAIVWAVRDYVLPAMRRQMKWLLGSRVTFPHAGPGDPLLSPDARDEHGSAFVQSPLLPTLASSHARLA